MAIALGNFQGISIAYATQVAASSDQLTYGNWVDEGQTVGPDADALDWLAQERAHNQHFVQPQISLFSPQHSLRQKLTIRAKEPEGGKVLMQEKDLTDEATIKRISKISDNPSIATEEDIKKIVNLLNKIRVLDERSNDIDMEYGSIEGVYWLALEAIIVGHPDQKIRRLAEAYYDDLQGQSEQDFENESVIASSKKFKELWDNLEEAVQAKNKEMIDRIVGLMLTKLNLEADKWLELQKRGLDSEAQKVMEPGKPYVFRLLKHPYPIVRLAFLRGFLGKENKMGAILGIWEVQKKFIERDLENSDELIRLSAVTEIDFFARLNVKEASDKLEYLSEHSSDNLVRSMARGVLMAKHIVEKSEKPKQ